jgi:hypothetical protein
MREWMMDFAVYACGIDRGREIPVGDRLEAHRLLRQRQKCTDVPPCIGKLPRKTDLELYKSCSLDAFHAKLWSIVKESSVHYKTVGAYK